MSRMDKAENRRRAIIKRLEGEPVVSVASLVESLHVTKETIRKDLAALEEAGLITRIRGGAGLTKEVPLTIPYLQRQEFNREEKVRVARAACTLVKEGESLLLEASTTAVAFCQELLKDRDLVKTLTVITNSIYIAQLFELGRLAKELFILGGWIRTSQGATHGTYIDECLEKFRLDKVFLSGAALDEDLNLSAYLVEDMVFQQRAIRRARSVILLLDKGKYPSSGLYAVDDLTSVQYLVTDAAFSEKELAILEDRHVEIIRA